jgi:hypothetical protein
MSTVVKQPGTPALKTKLVLPSIDDVDDDVFPLSWDTMSLSRGDIGVGGARLLLSDVPAVKGCLIF